MKEIERQALLSQLVKALHNAGSWAGRMHIQKYTFLAKKLLRIPADYEFVLYQRGPYSFDLDADIRVLRSRGYLDIESMPAPYGPRYSTTVSGDQFIEKFSPLAEDLSSALEKLAVSLGPKDAKDLELLATAYFVEEEGHPDEREKIKRLTQLKPHFDELEAEAAFAEVGELKAEYLGRPKGK